MKNCRHLLILVMTYFLMILLAKAEAQAWFLLCEQVSSISQEIK